MEINSPHPFVLLLHDNKYVLFVLCFFPSRQRFLVKSTAVEPLFLSFQIFFVYMRTSNDATLTRHTKDQSKIGS